MGLTINVDYDASVANAPAGFKTTVAAVVSYLESLFSTPITITIDVGYGEVEGEPLTGDDLGESDSNGIHVSYQTVRDALLARSSTPAETAAAASLPISDPTGGGSFYVAYAEAEALGLSSGPFAGGAAGAIGISSFDRFTWGTTNGAAPGTYDAFGTIEHEITEVMGRTAELGEFGDYTPMDLFRYSGPEVRDLTTAAGYFSVNGSTLLYQWNNPRDGGDGGDWSTNVSDDSFDAFSAEGVANPISATDLELMDVIGYTPAGVKSVPGTTVSVVSITAVPATGDITTGVSVNISVRLSAAVTVSGDTPTLSLNDGGTATYVAALSSGTSLVFSYTAQAGQSTSAAVVTGISSNGAAIQSAGTAAILTAAPTALPGLEINVPLINALSLDQQLELIYIGYFDRAADGSGFDFWLQQNTEAQSTGQSAATALTAIADSFTPQPETIALYPFLNGNSGGFNTPAAQSGLSSFISSVYENLFDHAADPAGAAYWFDQISDGSIGLGAAILAIANGAIGTDANILQNKITVAVDFTNATNASGLEGTGSSSTAFFAAARSVLSGVDGSSLNDASVAADINAVSTYVASATNASMPAASADQDDAVASATGGPVIVLLSNSVIDPGQGGHQIQFIAGTSDETVVLHAGGTDVIGGFAPSAGDVLNLASLFAEVGVNANAALPDLGSYLKIVDQGTDAVLLFDPAGQGGGAAAAVLRGLGDTVTSLGVLTGQHAIQV